jgi:hypothetical protein
MRGRTRRPRLGKPIFHCGENEIQASLISSASVGATPTPATIFREVIRLPDCKSGVIKQSQKRRTGALPALPTISGIRCAELATICAAPSSCAR